MPSPSFWLSKLENTHLADSELRSAQKYIPLHRHFTVSGLSSSSPPNWNLANVSGPKTLMVLPRSDFSETALIVKEVEVYLDGSGTWSDNLFAGQTALSTGLRLAEFTGEVSKRDYWYRFSPASGGLIDNRGWMTSCDSFVYINDSGLTPNRTLKMRYDFHTIRVPIYIPSGDSLRIILPGGDTVQAATVFQALVKGFSIR